MKLFLSQGSPQCLKALAALEVTGARCHVEYVSHEDKVVPFLSRPALPALLLPCGQLLFSSNAICRYLFEVNAQESNALCDQWLEWEATNLQPALLQALHTAVLQGKASDVSKFIQGPLNYMDQTLNKGKTTYLTGELVSVADIVLWAALYPLFSDPTVPSGEHKTVTLWFSRMNDMSACQSSAQNVLQGKGLQGMRSYMQRQAAPQSSHSRDMSTSSPAEGDDGERLVSEEEMEAAALNYSKGLAKCQETERKHPILPQEGQRNILVTSALPYVNNVPHLGNIIGCVLSADVFSRYGRLRGWNLLFVCGTDEYGTATENKAREEGLTPQQICDKYHAVHSSIYEWFQIDFDFFGRTTTTKQTEIAQDIFWRLLKHDFLVEDTVEQLRCENCKRFLADRFVEGTCPFCNYPEARGDQCDKCGRLINAVELKEPQCKVCKQTPVIRTSKHLFLNLPKLEQLLDKSFTVDQRFPIRRSPATSSSPTPPELIVESYLSTWRRSYEHI